MSKELQELLAAAYQALGALDGPAEMLDNLSAAANGQPLPHSPMAGLPVLINDLSSMDRAPGFYPDDVGSSPTGRAKNSITLNRPLKHWNITPKKRGLYVRDWRGTKILPKCERRLTLDLWEPLPPGDEFGPGFWYVWSDMLSGWNDASHDCLPWREATRAEKEAFFRNKPVAKDAL